MKPRHFISLLDMTPDELGSLIRRASELKAMHHRNEKLHAFPTKNTGDGFRKSIHPHPGFF